MLDICVLTAGADFDLLKKCLDHLQKDLEASRIPAKVYLLDNGSPTEERLKNKEIFSHPVVSSSKRLNRNVGFPGGANAAIRMGSEDLVIFLSDDIAIMPGTIRSLMNTMENKTIAMCGLKLIFPLDGSSPNGPAGKVQHVGQAVDIRGRIIHQFIGWSADNPKTCQTEEVFSVTGAAFAIRRKMFEKVRGFDLAYGLGTFEDVDLCLKLRQAGGKIFLDADALAEHYVGATAQKTHTPFPLEQNQNIFRSRWVSSGLIQWNDWVRR